MKSKKNTNKHENKDLLEDLDEFTRAYIRCALWASIDNQTGESISENHTKEDFSTDTLKQIIADCEFFQRDNKADFLVSDAIAGHDFWMKRNSFGAGYPDDGFVLQINAEDTISHTVISRPLG